MRKELSERLDRSHGMVSSAQLKRRQTGGLSCEGLPTGLARGIWLVGGEQLRYCGTAQWCEERTTAGALRRDEYEGANPLRCRCQSILRTPQIHLELLDAASTSDHRRLSYGSRAAGVHEKPQRVGTDMQEIRDAGCKQTVRPDQHTILRQKIEPLQQTVQGQCRL